ncbi:hypothetical protein D3C73_1066680 [compost metagenome]
MGRTVLQVVHQIGQLVEAQRCIDGPFGNIGLASRRLGDDGQAKCMESARLHHGIAHAQPLEGSLCSIFQLLCGVLVEGEHHDALGGHKATVDGVGSLGHHRGGLAGAGCGHHLHPVVEADDRACLFLGQRPALDPVQEVLGQH